MKKTTLLTFLLLSLFFPFFLFAQAIPLTGNLILSPEFPEPLQEVTITLESFSFDPSRAFISWTVNNKKVLNGNGETKLKISSGQAGEQTLISVSAREQGGGVYNDQITLSPASIQLLWEATDSYVPPFYKGKTLLGEGANVRFVAIPSFYSTNKRIPPNLVSYNWTFNDNLARESSGLGKQTYRTQLNYLENENTVKVQAISLEGETQAEARSILIPNSVVPRLYITNTLNGPDYTHATRGRIEINKETSFTFEPYFISGTTLTSPNLSFSWSLNGLPITPQNENLVTIIPKENAQGSGTLEISVENTKKYLQQVTSSLIIVFNTLQQ